MEQIPKEPQRPESDSTSLLSALTSQVPPWVFSWPVAVVSLTLCFPIGLGIVWAHPRWTVRQKSVWSGCWLVLMVIGLAAGPDEEGGDTALPSAHMETEIKPERSGIKEELAVNQTTGLSAELKELTKQNESVFVLSVLAEDFIRLNRQAGLPIEDATRTKYVVLINGGEAQVGEYTGRTINFQGGFKVTQNESGLIVLVKHEFSRSNGLATNDYTKVVIREHFTDNSTYEQWSLLVDDQLGSNPIRPPKYVGSVERIK